MLAFSFIAIALGVTFAFMHKQPKIDGSTLPQLNVNGKHVQPISYYWLDTSSSTTHNSESELPEPSLNNLPEINTLNRDLHFDISVHRPPTEIIITEYRRNSTIGEDPEELHQHYFNRDFSEELSSSQSNTRLHIKTLKNTDIVTIIAIYFNEETIRNHNLNPNNLVSYRFIIKEDQ